jgi:hypothetical protein
MTNQQQRQTDAPLPTTIEETPSVPAVTTIHEEHSSSIREAVRFTATAAVIGAIVASNGFNKKETPKQPEVRLKQTQGLQGIEECPQKNEMMPQPYEIYGIDGIRVKEGPLRSKKCTFDDVNENVKGIQIIENGETDICYFSEIWTPGAALRLAGEVEGDISRPGRIFLRDGVVDVKIGLPVGDEKMQQIQKEVIVEGEATMTVTTEGRVSVAIMAPEHDQKIVEVMVIAEEGNAMIVQEGRKIHLAPCEKIKIPLNKEYLEGCFIASAGKNNQEQNHASKIILLAGGILLVLRRRKKKRS